MRKTLAERGGGRAGGVVTGGLCFSITPATKFAI